ncbi:MAG: Sua5/YciO/YrdC/YwlC family protein [Bacteroidota bacterium]
MSNEVSPIILLEPNTKDLSIDIESIAPGLNRVGCMIPYAPLFQLILREYQKPVIATSGNISGSPIIYENNEAGKALRSIADVIVSNDRDIVIPQDDSVISFSKEHHHKIILRRSRGLAPTYLQPKMPVPGDSILAVGAQMKSSFTLTNKKLVYISQYLGDMDSYLTQKHYEKTIEHFFSIFNPQVSAVIGDLHPDYFTTHYGTTIAEKLAIPFKQLQHHEAHFYAILAEHGLLDSKEQILGVIWDGTGYGHDGQIWGGEFFIYEGKRMERVAHLPYFPFILGNKMPREPRISALALCASINSNTEFLKNKFNETEWSTYQNLLPNAILQTSSMGRFFDAVASLVLNIDKTSFEGEAAMQLEAAARDYINQNGFTSLEHYPVDNGSISNCISGIIYDKKNRISDDHIAAKFHLSLVHLIRQQAENHNSKILAFSGGVFQNGLLVDLIITYLKDEYELKFHKELSPNDENISFGQLAWFTTHKNNNR